MNSCLKLNSFSSLIGDVFGPVFPSTPITTDSMLSRSLRGTEATLFNLASTLWSLHYLRLTNQLESHVLYSGLNDMNVQMAELIRLYSREGSFRAHTNSNPSVWVTVSYSIAAGVCTKIN